MHSTTKARLQRIQQHLGVAADGVLGDQTLSALETVLFESGTPSEPSLTLSQKGIDLIIKHEISSKQYYELNLTHPTWPGGESGITIGIGYDLGYATAEQFQADWQSHLTKAEMSKLVPMCGIKGTAAMQYVPSLTSVTVTFEAAKHVFIYLSLPKYARQTRKTFPGVENLTADAQAALVSLIYNRGSSIQGDSRREMAEIKSMVTRQAYSDIAQQIINMKRLWQNKGLDGLLHRRDEEAKLVMQSHRYYAPNEFVRIA